MQADFGADKQCDLLLGHREPGMSLRIWRWTNCCFKRFSQEKDKLSHVYPLQRRDRHVDDTAAADRTGIVGDRATAVLAAGDDSGHKATQEWQEPGAAPTWRGNQFNRLWCDKCSKFTCWKPHTTAFFPFCSLKSVGKHSNLSPSADDWSSERAGLPWKHGEVYHNRWLGQLWIGWQCSWQLLLDHGHKHDVPGRHSGAAVNASATNGVTTAAVATAQLQHQWGGSQSFFLVCRQTEKLNSGNHSHSHNICLHPKCSNTFCSLCTQRTLRPLQCNTVMSPFHLS